jgi:hypothetical protein
MGKRNVGGDPVFGLGKRRQVFSSVPFIHFRYLICIEVITDLICFQMMKRRPLLIFLKARAIQTLLECELQVSLFRHFFLFATIHLTPNFRGKRSSRHSKETINVTIRGHNPSSQ